jgi:transposase
MPVYDYSRVVSSYPSEVWDELRASFERTGSARSAAEAGGVPVEHARYMLKQLGFVLVPATASRATQFIPRLAEELATTDASLLEIAARLGISYPTATRYCREGNLDVGLNNRRWARWGAQSQQWYAEGVPLIEISSRTGILQGDLSARMKEAGVEVVQGRRVGMAPKRAQYLDKVLEMNDQGLSDHKIALSLGVSEGSVGSWLRNAGRRSLHEQLERGSRTDRRKDRRPSPACLEALDLMDQGQSNIEIAEALGKSTNTIGTWRSRYRGGTVKQRVAKGIVERKVLELFDAGVLTSHIHAEASTDFYTVKSVLMKNGRLPNDGSLTVCALDGCDEVTSGRSRYCCQAHGAKGAAPSRLRDPAKWHTLVCPNQGDARCLSYGGKEVEVRVSQHRTYCSNHCANVMLPKLHSDAGLSGYEKVFEGLCLMLKVRFERFPRESDVVLFDPREPSKTGTSEYGPDYWVFIGNESLAVEIKGQDGAAQHLKWNAWKAHRPERLAVVFKETMEQLRTAPNRSGFLSTLWNAEWNGEGDTPPELPEVV